MKRLAITMAALATATVLLVPPASAKAPWVKKAKDLGHADLVKNCASCHAKAMPKATDKEMSPLGTWLVEQKKVKNAKEIDLTWLKEYKPAAIGK